MHTLLLPSLSCPQLESLSNAIKWEVLQTPLNYETRGSKVLFTTCSKRVASTMQSNKASQLEQLHEEHC
ncbi:hypothetical protein JHK82_036746 [Glycine max]|nr:hypothetical protein JHK86_036946 [Glycine max]KAG5113477.1 hypothetical protein JHK82_036746 [Glycine max]KHN37663.1 hypothetical protein glysoja_007366 [Glycine soja]